MATKTLQAKLMRWHRRTPFRPFFIAVDDGRVFPVRYQQQLEPSPNRLRPARFRLMSPVNPDLTVEYASVRHIAPLTAAEAIKYAETRLPGAPIHQGVDPRWQAILFIAEFIESEPQPVWEFVHRWGRHRQSDLRTAIAVCLLEHLLEHHFAEYFPRVEQAALASALFGDTCLRLWKFGQAEEPAFSKRLDRLYRRIEKQRRQRTRLKTRPAPSTAN